MENKGMKLNYSGKSIYCGIDSHLNDWKITIKVEGVFYKTFSQDPSPQILVNYLSKNFPGGDYYSAYEAGFCGFWIHRELVKLGINNIVVNPSDIPTTDKQRKQKEDKRDSRKIADCLSQESLNAIYVPEQIAEADRQMLRVRKTIVKDVTRNKNRIKSLLRLYGIKIPSQYSGSCWSRGFINWLKQIEFSHNSIKESLEALIDVEEFLRKKQLSILQKIRKLSKEDRYKNNVALLLSVPGVGLLTAMMFLTEIIDLKRFKEHKELCSYIGLIPSTKSSGDNEKVGQITKRSNRTLKEGLIESAWVAIKNDPVLMLSYQDYIKRMKPQKAIIRIAKKLVSRMKHVLVKETPYEICVVK